MIEIQFSEDDIKKLSYERFNHPHPRVQRKMEALWLKSQGLFHKDICRLTGISKATLCTYLRDYQQGGIEKLKEIRFYQPQSELKQHQTTIKDYFCQYPPTTIKEAMAKIEELTGLKRSETQIRYFLANLDIKLPKMRRSPPKTPPNRQDESFEKKFQPRFEKVHLVKRGIYFAINRLLAGTGLSDFQKVEFVSW